MIEIKDDFFTSKDFKLMMRVMDDRPLKLLIGWS